MWKLGSGFCNGEGYGVFRGVENVREVRFRRDHKVSNEGEELLESEGKRVFEIWKHCLQEVVTRVRKLKEENALHCVTVNPRKVKEG